MLLAAAIAVCLPTPQDTNKGWASWYASPLKSSHNYNNPWYTRGKKKVMNFAAVKSFEWNDSPYYVQVCSVKTGKCAIAKVVDHCEGCTGKRLIDLSPILFEAIGIPLHHGVAKITLRRLYGYQGPFNCSAASRQK